jgi:hypothetical protein
MQERQRCWDCEFVMEPWQTEMGGAVTVVMVVLRVPVSFGLRLEWLVGPALVAGDGSSVEGGVLHC